MKSLIVAALGGIVCIAAAVGVGAIAPAPFDYAHAGEAGRQRYLNGLADGLRKGFPATVGKSAEIETLAANARDGSIDVDIRLREARAETLKESEVDAIKTALAAKNCAMLAGRGLLEEGVTMRVFMKRPSGGALAGFAFDEKSCASFIDG